MSELPTLLACLPVGYRSRPATAADAGAVHRLIAECEHQRHGRALTGIDRVAEDLGLTDAEPDPDTVLVTGPKGQPAGWGWVKGRRASIRVHPGHLGRGLGSALLAWSEARARQQGTDRLSQSVSDGDHPARALLQAGGYFPLVTEWLLEIAMPVEPEVPKPPAGITMRPFRAGDEQEAYQVTEDAFDEWQRRRKTFAQWARLTVENTAFEPAASPLALAGDQMVGVVLSSDVPDSDEGYVERVAVRRDHRGRGIARLLLQETFRTFYQQGKRTCTLWTHTATGALPLYQQIGMTVRHSTTVYSKPLTIGRPGT
ncbi:acetyltransferase [Streptomyces sp. MUSC 125]|uniref:GNAT family N-acetyltransferase n=1 Tax=unclassified Streptomyces TaxID=2593676 RepID=UPI00057F94D2|nr:MULTISPECIES: GNAT family N-acetyltransferase [unclassified Streptomyces]KIE24399.1 acetyltransferase [Streptomyces sp. MUSC 125]MCH0559439.1 GNAT family N-acetyltransferase [Streptomyces sp. MUM 16J]